MRADVDPEAVDRNPTSPQSGATPRKKANRQRFTEITASHPYGTLCGNIDCRQPHAHTEKPTRGTGNIRWPNSYCFQCQVSARMGNHICRHCHEILDTCNCEVVPINGGVAMHVVRKTQILPWAPSLKRPVAPTQALNTDVEDAAPTRQRTQAPTATQRTRTPNQTNNLRGWLNLNAAPPARRVFAKRARSRMPAAVRPLTLGTDCSGMDAVAHAVKSLRIPLTHVFASDPDPAAREHMQAKHTIEHLYTFLQERPPTHTDLDVYAAGRLANPSQVSDSSRDSMTHARTSTNRRSTSSSQPGRRSS